MKKLATFFFTFLAFSLAAQPSLYPFKDTLKLQNNLRLATNGHDQSFSVHSQSWGGGVLTLGEIRDTTGSFPDTLQNPYSGFFILFSSNLGDSIWSKKYIIKSDTTFSFSRFYATSSEIRIFGLFKDTNYFSGIHTWLLDSAGNFISKQVFSDSSRLGFLQMEHMNTSPSSRAFMLMCQTSKGDYTNLKHGYKIFKYQDSSLSLLYTRQDTQSISYRHFKYHKDNFYVAGIDYSYVYYPFVDVFDKKMNLIKRVKHHREMMDKYYEYFQLLPLNDTMRVFLSFKQDDSQDYFGTNTMFASGRILTDSIVIEKTFGLEEPPHRMLQASKIVTLNDTDLVQVYFHGSGNRYISVYNKNFERYENYPKYYGSPEEWQDYGSFAIPFNIIMMPNNRIFGTGSFYGRGNHMYTIDTWTITTRPIELNKKSSAHLPFSCDVFPNPFNQSINIEIEGNTQTIDIYLITLNGTQILYKQSNNSKITLQTTTVNPGFYFLKVSMKHNSIGPFFYRLIKY